MKSKTCGKEIPAVAAKGEAPGGLDMEAFAEAVGQGTKLWADVPDPVAWVREVRGCGSKGGNMTNTHGAGRGGNRR